MLCTTQEGDKIDVNCSNAMGIARLISDTTYQTYAPWATQRKYQGCFYQATVTSVLNNNYVSVRFNKSSTKRRHASELMFEVKSE